MSVNKNNRMKLNKWLLVAQNWCFGSACPICRRKGAGDQLCVHCLRELPIVSEACSGCGDRLNTRLMVASVCGKCLQRANNTHAIMAFWYRAPVDQWIISYKFHQDWLRGAEMVKVLVDRISTLTDFSMSPEVLIPVPMQATRLRQRGYNPAADIAYQLSRHLSIKVDPGLLCKQRESKPQMQLPYSARVKNIRNTFKVRSTDLPAHVAIVDDVVTTGATINEICRLLIKYQPDIRITIWALARTVRD